MEYSAVNGSLINLYFFSVYRSSHWRTVGCLQFSRGCYIHPWGRRHHLFIDIILSMDWWTCWTLFLLYLFIYLSIHLFIYLFIYLFTDRFIYLFIYLLIYLSDYLSIYLSICLSIYLFNWFIFSSFLFIFYLSFMYPRSQLTIIQNHIH